MIWHHLKFHVFWIELDISLYAQKAVLICHQFKHLETIFVSFFSFKKKNISVMKFASEMEITFLLLSLYTSSGWRNYMLQQLSGLELSLSNTEFLGFHGNLSCRCLPCTGFCIFLPQKSFIKIGSSHQVLVENLS